jgi:hypothetical protein
MANSGTSNVKVLPQSLEQDISLRKKLNLTSLSELTPGKRKLYDCIQNKGSVLCKLRKKYKAKKLMKKLCCVDSDPLMENLSSSLTVALIC